jgi:hypothetical protein
VQVNTAANLSTAAHHSRTLSATSINMPQQSFFALIAFQAWLSPVPHKYTGSGMFGVYLSNTFIT